MGEPQEGQAPIEAEGPLEVGLVGATLAARRGAERCLVKRLPPGRTPPPGADDPFPWRGEDVNGAPALVAPWVEGALIGEVVGWSPRQARCVETARELDPTREHGFRLRSAPLPLRVRWVLSLAEALARLHAEGRRAPLITPWNVVLAGDRMLPLEADLGVSLAELDEEGRADALLFLAPEVVRALPDAGGEVVGDPAADVYALAATARAFLLRRLPEPAAGAGSREERAGRGLTLLPQRAISRELDALLAQALSTEPTRRPSAATFAAELRALADGGRIAWRAPAGWMLYAGVLAAALTAVAAVGGVAPSPLERARRSFVAATREPDIDKRQVELAAVRDPAHDGEQLAEARRTQAVGTFVRWSRGLPTTAAAQPEPLELALALDRLERHVLADPGAPQPLRQRAAAVVGVLRSWEDPDPDAQTRGRALLDDLARGADAPLATFARAARAFAAIGLLPGRELEEAAQPSALEAALEGAPAVLDPASYADYDPAPVAPEWEAGWLAELVSGRVLLARGQPDAAVSALERSLGRVRTFSGRVALGAALAARGGPGDLELARDRLSEALAERAISELWLMLGQIALQEAERGDTGALARAEHAFRQAGLTNPEGGAGVLATARRARVQVELRRALEGPSRAGEERLRATIAEAVGLPELEALLPDLHAALGLVLAKGGDSAAARAELRHLFRKQDPGAGWRELPPLEPPPPTRDRARVLRVLQQGLLEEVEALVSRVALAEADVREARAELAPQLEGVIARARELALDPLPAELAHALLVLASARWGAPDPLDLADVRTRLDLAPERLDQAAQPALWATWVAARAEAALIGGRDPWLTIRERARALASLDPEAAPPAARARVAELAAQRGEALRAALQAGLEAWLAGEEAAALLADPTLQRERALEVQATLIAAAEVSSAAGDDARRLTATRALAWAATLAAALERWSEGISAAERGLALAEELPEEPSLTEARKLLALAHGDLLVGGGDALGSAAGAAAARDAYARAGGVARYERLLAGAREGSLPELIGPRGREDLPRRRLADLISELAAARLPDAIAPGERIEDASELALELILAARLDAAHPGPHVHLARLEMARGLAERAERSALRGYNAAIRAVRERPSLRPLLVRASALYCEALAHQGEARVASAGFGRVADAGARAAKALPEQALPGEIRHAPRYWQARHLLARGERAGAASALRAFGEALGDGPPPRAATRWREELKQAEGK